MSDTIETFSAFGLPEPLLQALTEVGYETPSPIQRACIPALLEGHDLLGEAQTGTGKTAAFALPMLARIDLARLEPQVLVLTPTRELAIQVSEAFQRYAKHLRGFHVLPVYGGQGMGLQLKQLRRGAHVIVGTPGRVMDHLERKSLTLDSLQGLVLDEADEMLRMGFIDDVEWILEHTPAERQTALFSATMSEPIRRVARTHMREPREVRIAAQTQTVSAINQLYWQVSGTNKLDALTRILDVEDGLDAALIFVRTKTATAELAERLEARGYAAAALNGDMSQVLRERVIEQLKSGALDIVVATDVAARGIDVPRISHVINYDIPYDPEAYVHRIGRTGRAGRSGTAILFVAPREFRMLRTIERATRATIEPLHLPSREAVADKRVALFRKAVGEIMQTESLDFFVDVVAQLEREHEGDLPRIAGALCYLAQRDKPLRLGEHEEEFEHAPARAPRERDGDGGARGQRDRGPRPEHIEPAGELVPYRIAVGRMHDVSPREIVGAIANEAGLSSRYIGRIEIFDDYSLVGLPAGLPASVMGVLAKTRVKQRTLEIRLWDQRDGSPAAPRRERTRPPKRDRDAAPYRRQDETGADGDDDTPYGEADRAPMAERERPPQADTERAPRGPRTGAPFRERTSAAPRDAKPPYRGRDDGGAPREPRAYRDASAPGDRPARPFRDGEAKPYAKRAAKPAGDRPAKPFGEGVAKPFGERPARPYGDRPAKPAGERPAKPYGERASRPAGERPAKPFRPGGPGKPRGPTASDGGFAPPRRKPRQP